jgi:ATP-dependent helicase/nuclease subunit B
VSHPLRTIAVVSDVTTTAPETAGIETVVTRFGRPALEALADQIRRAKRDDPLAPVTVVVPANHVGVTARRALAGGSLGPVTSRGPGVAAVTFLTPYRLAELLGAPGLAASARRPVSTPVIAAALRQALRERPGVFAPVADHPATEEALVTAYRELADLSAGATERLAATGPRAADVVALCRHARGRLAHDWYDESDLVSAALRALAAEPSTTSQIGRSQGSSTEARRPGLSREEDAASGRSGRRGELVGARVVLHLPQDLSRKEAALLRAVAAQVPTSAVVALTGDPRADAGVRRSLGRLGALRPEAAAAEVGAPAWGASAEATRVVTTSDPDDEVRAVVRAVLDAARSGVPLERIAVLYPVAQPYLRLLHEHLAAAGIQANGMAAQALKGRALGRTLLGLLALRDHGYRRRDVLGLLTDAPLRRDGGPDGQVWRSAEWERLAREAAVVGDRADWDRRLARLAEEVDRRADEMGDVDDERLAARVERYRRRAERIRTLRGLVLGLIDDLDDAASTVVPWRQRVRWLRRMATRLVGPESARATWPPVERKAAERVDAALDRLAGLDELDGPASLDVFRRTLELELDADLGRVGRMGEGVLVAPLSLAVGLDLDLVAVVGMAEGTLPAPTTEDSLLPDRERQTTGGELPLRRELVDRQRRHLHAALASARRHLLCAPRGDLRASNERTLSRWLDEIRARTGDGVVDEVASFARAISTAAFPATGQEYRLRMPRRTAADDPVVVAGRELQHARHSSRFTRYDGNLAGYPVRSPLDDVVSATRLESWAVCPHAFFVRHVLGVDTLDDPADLLWISPLDRGSLVHEVLEGFLRAVLDRPPDEQPPPDRAWTDADHALLRRIAEERFADYEARGLVGRPLFWARDRARILLRLERFLREDSHRRAVTRARPLAAELDFGLPGSELGAVEVPISAGRSLSFRGAADRVDRADDGTLRVVDYKTGRPDDYRALSPDNPDDRGTHLQLPVYGLAARAAFDAPEAPVVAEYWFVTDRDELTPVGYAVTDDVLERVGDTLGVIVDGIHAGVFPARPTATSSDPFVRCRYCDPDGLGVTDARRAWERKRHDPAVAGYAALAEPPEDEVTTGVDNNSNGGGVR